MCSQLERQSELAAAGSNLRPEPAVTPTSWARCSAHMPQVGGVGPRALRYHASVAHNKILNGACVILSPFIAVELTSWKALTLPQVTPF
jgi:hypothetical protein